MTKVYISGPITGITNYKQNFEEATKEIRAAFGDDVEIINPSYFADIFRGSHEEYMQMCRRLWELTKPDVLYQLRGWEDSRGCNRERGWADTEGAVVMRQSAEDTEEIKPEPKGYVRKAPTEKTCPICGKTFEAVGRTKYCSAECRAKATREQNKQSQQRHKDAKHSHTAEPKTPEIEIIQAKSNLVETEKQAREQGISYGKLKAQQYQETLKAVEDKEPEDHCEGCVYAIVDCVNGLEIPACECTERCDNYDHYTAEKKEAPIDNEAGTMR